MIFILLYNSIKVQTDVKEQIINWDKVKSDLYSILISDLIQIIQEDFPSTKFKVGSFYGAESGYRLIVKVNTLEFESLLISIQNPEKKD